MTEDVIGGSVADGMTANPIITSIAYDVGAKGVVVGTFVPVGTFEYPGAVTIRGVIDMRLVRRKLRAANVFDGNEAAPFELKVALEPEAMVSSATAFAGGSLAFVVAVVSASAMWW